MAYRYALDSSKGKFTCPKCLKPKRFSRYWDIEEQLFVDATAGRCDRPKCGYHLTPKQYIQNTGAAFTNQFTKTYKPLPPSPKDYLNASLISDYANNYSTNKFISFLGRIFEKSLVKRMILRYLLGTINTPWKGCVIFWELDQKGILRYGKIMEYYSHNGKRVKEPYSHVGSFHKVYLGKERRYHYDRCLFGLHLINENLHSPIAIVESEKTAIIMSEINPKYIWMACGSINGITEHMLNPISDRRIILFPDLSLPDTKGNTAYIYWTQKVDELSQIGFKITVSSFLYSISDYNEKLIGFDIADYYINDLMITKQKIKTQVPLQQLTVLTEKDKDLNFLIFKNPAISSLIKSFQLETD